MALNAAIGESMNTIIERSANISCITTNVVVRKDFNLENDESKLRQAAHLMVQYLTGNLAIFTGKEMLRTSFTSSLMNYLSQLRLKSLNVEVLCKDIVNNNMDLACTFLERAAHDRAVFKVEEQLVDAYAARGSFYQPADPQFPLPDILRPVKGSPILGRVYSEFSSTDFKVDATGMIEAQQKLDSVLKKLDIILAGLPKDDPSVVLNNSELNTTIQNVTGIFFRLDNPHRQELATIFSRKVFVMLIESINPLQMDICLMLLKSIRIAYNDIAKDLTTMLISAMDDSILNIEAVIGLFRDGLIFVSKLDTNFARKLSSGNLSLLELVIQFIDTIVVVEKIIPPTEFARTLGTLNDYVSHSPNSPISELITHLVDRVRALISGVSKTSEKFEGDLVIKREEEKKQASADKPFPQQCFELFDDWLNLFLHQPGLPDKLLSEFIAQFEKEGIFKNVDTVQEFFRIVIPPCIDISNQVSESDTSENESQGNITQVRYEFIDSLAKLVVVLVRFLPSTNSSGVTNLSVLSILLSVVADIFISHFEMYKKSINQKPYYRLLSILVQDLCISDDIFEIIHLDILLLFCRTLHSLQPLYLPIFCFSWLQLVSNRVFLSSILLSRNPRCLNLYQTLLVDLFKFLERFLRKAELTDSVLHLYRGTLRFLLVLLHDFPEFLCEYHFSFCDVIPSTCIQMRNLILSAFPRNMRLPDPFLPNLKVDLLPEIKLDPKIRSDTSAALIHSGFNKEVDLFLKKRGVPSFFSDLLDKLYLSPEQAVVRGTVYNIPLINSLVLYVGSQGIKILRQEQSGEAPSAAMELFQYLASNLDEEGRYYFLNAIANQLRYPNNHTHYFSCILLFLFTEAVGEIVREQITKVLLERLIVHRPHPWGLLITFIELIKSEI